KQNDEFMGVNRIIEKKGLDKCRKVLGPTYCEDVGIHRASGLAFISCDPSRPYFNSVLGFGNSSMAKGDGSIWMYDLNSNASPILLTTDFKKPFHPVGLSIAPLGVTPIKTAVAPLLFTLVVVNHNDNDNRTVEVFDFRSDTKSLIHRKTISSPHISSPNRVAAVTYQPSVDGIPSFFVSNDHYFTNSRWRRVERYTAAAFGSVSFYNARADKAMVIGWRHQHPSGIAATEDASQIFVSDTWSGNVVEYRAHFFNREILNDKINTSGGQVTIIWPLYLTTNSVTADYAVTGVDFDPLSNDLYIVGHPKFRDFIAHAESLATGNYSSRISPSLVTKITHIPSKSNDHDGNIFVRKKYTAETFFEDDGTTFGSSSGVAVDALRNKLLIVGSYESGFMECKLN
ncbi:11363_t:CDS:2, partial [Acaulospora morrowiae]